MTPWNSLALITLFAGLAACGRGGGADNGAPAWQAIEVVPAPAARHDASMVAAVGSGQIFLFGGRNADDCLSDLWTFSPQRKRWEALSPGGGPAARSGAGLAWDPDSKRLILFGGYCHDGLGATHFFGDLWFYSRSDGWTREFISGGPGPRAWHAMRVRQGRLVVFGGTADAPGHHRNDVWELDLEKLHWRRLASDGGPLMAGRSVLMADPGAAARLIVLGQHGVQKPTQVAIWNLDLTVDRWNLRAGDDTGDLARTSGDLQLAGATTAGWLFGAEEPGDAKAGWDVRWTSLGADGVQAWRRASGLPGPDTPFGIGCAEEEGQRASWICFGGVWRDKLSGQTWRFSIGSKGGAPEARP